MFVGVDLWIKVEGVRIVEGVVVDFGVVFDLMVDVVVLVFGFGDGCFDGFVWVGLWVGVDGMCVE